MVREGEGGKCMGKRLFECVEMGYVLSSTWMVDYWAQWSNDCEIRTYSNCVILPNGCLYYCERMYMSAIYHTSTVEPLYKGHSLQIKGISLMRTLSTAPTT